MTGRTWPAVAGLATVLTYNTWVVAPPLFGHSRVFLGYLSELSAADQPHHLFFRIGDVVTGLLVAALALSVHTAPRRGPGSVAGRWRQVIIGALLLFAGATILDAIFVLDCAPTHDAACHSAEHRGLLSTGHYVHEATSVAAQVGATGSLVVGALALRSGRAAGSSGVYRFVLGLGVVNVLALVVMSIALAVGLPGFGYAQAVTVGTASLWFASIGLGVLDR